MAAVIVGLLFLMASALAILQPRIALLAVVFFAPWAGFDVDIGLRVTAYLVFLAPLTGVILLRIIHSTYARSAASSLGAFWLVLGYSVLWSLVQIPFLPDSVVAGGALRSPEFRAIIQVVMFLITVSPVFIVLLIVKSLQDIAGLVKVYLVSVTILAAVGWLQLAIWIATGQNPFPIGYMDTLLGGEALTRSGQMRFEGEWVYRMNSFGGEPKGLGVGLAVGLLLIQAGVLSRKRVGLFLWPFLFVSMVATFSTMALLAWFGASLVLYATTRDLGFALSKTSMRVSKRVLFAVLVLAGAVLLVFVAPDSRIVEIIEMRTVERVTTGSEYGGFLEDFNVAVLGYLQSRPLAGFFGVGLGNIHLYADPFLPDYAVRYAGGTAFVAKSALLRWVSELGAISFLVFLSWSLGRFRRAVRLTATLPGKAVYAEVLAKASVSITAFWLVSGYISAQFYLTLGVSVALVWIFRQQRHLGET